MTGPGKRRPTLSDVADMVGVDPSLVSRVLRNDPRGFASSSTRERIVAAAEKIGYRANAAARGLRSSRTMALGLLLPGFTSPVYTAIVHGVEVRAKEHGYGLVLGTHAAGDPHETMTSMLMHGSVDALLVASGRIEDRTLRRLVDEVPQTVVLVNRQVRGISASVVLRDADAAAVAVRHLVELGHRRICGVFGPATLDTMVRRRHGFVTECAATDVDCGVIELAERDHAAGFEGAMRALERRKRPTAIVAATFPMAVGVLAALHQRGIAVPSSMSVLALHDDSLASYLVPPLTTVWLPTERLGAEAVELAIALIGGGQPRRVVVPDEPHVVCRGSTAAP
ncbi:LacI family DNA-binding transcriptional regulator [Mycolicibacterium goodii]|uniref:LacI family DNA-binding transcriptional regulator n=1 Tax=Mycolicibacterium goodii TaxID=134601 RepID=UPI001BDC32FF|nr:LacI family DNA-binding transcriptional regulator [Mycolicibacterium goodii]MBU8831035.1 LacI family transcriptional regulator [Mycolicibacterium goodii]